jgi:FAD-linked oxidoreductase
MKPALFEQRGGKLPTSFQNWNRNFVCHPRERLRPSSADEVARIVRRARRDGLKVRPVGSGYSYTPLAATDGLMVDLSALDEVGPIDRAAGTVTVGSGIRLDRLIRALARQGMALENAGDIDQQTLAGAISTGTHGSGIAMGSLSSQVVALTVVDGKGDVVEIDGRQADLLNPARIGLGVLGIIVAVTLHVRPHYHLRLDRGPATSAAVLADLAGPLRDNRIYEFFWFQADNAAFTRRWNDAPATDSTAGLSDTIQRFVVDVLLENLYFWLAAQAIRLWPASRSLAFKICWAMVPTDRHVRPAEISFATPRFLRHHETEYAVPLDRAEETLRRLDEVLKVKPMTTLIPLQVRFVAAEDIPLSPSEGRDVMYVAVHTEQHEDYRDLFRRCEEVFLDVGGRPHWGKLHNLQAADLKPRYPRWEEFQAARRRLDPDGIFLNDYLMRLLGPA